MNISRTVPVNVRSSATTCLFFASSTQSLALFSSVKKGNHKRQVTIRRVSARRDAPGLCKVKYKYSQAAARKHGVKIPNQLTHYAKNKLPLHFLRLGFGRSVASLQRHDPVP